MIAGCESGKSPDLTLVLITMMKEALSLTTLSNNAWLMVSGGLVPPQHPA